MIIYNNISVVILAHLGMREGHEAGQGAGAAGGDAGAPPGRGTIVLLKQKHTFGIQK